MNWIRFQGAVPGGPILWTTIVVVLILGWVIGKCGGGNL